STDPSTTMQNEVSTSTTGDMAAATGSSVDTSANMAANGGQDTIVSNAASTPAAVAPDCGLNWILFDFDQYSITSNANQELAVMAKILKENATYTASLSAHTDARGSNEYNDQLSLNRANAAKNVLISMGIDAARIKTSASSEADPIATNTDDDSGRKFNRRVVLRVFDANNVEICKSIPPDVPGSLQAK
ncbi:MAG TPA: OmpA family protein, partial [Saprospiraceae bacterium]|nr:OmpA family protein [Saprospiraceae bacterium]